MAVVKISELTLAAAAGDAVVPTSNAASDLTGCEDHLLNKWGIA